VRGPRQAPGPRSGGAGRGPGGARGGGAAHGPGGPREPGGRSYPRHVQADGLAAREPEVPRVAESAPPLAPNEPGSGDPQVSPTAAPPGELTGLWLLLDQLDALLRDPTLALALRRFNAKLTGGLRDLARALRLPRLRLRLPHLPRWLLLLPLLLLLALGLPALLATGDDDRRSGAPASGQIALPGVGMPALQAAPDDPPPARVALVVDDSYAPAALRRELRSLGAWLADNHAPGTRVTLIDATTGRASAPLSAADLARGAATRAQPGTSAAVRSAFAGRGGRRLLVNVGAPAPATSASALTVATRRGAPAPSSVGLRRGERARVTIDANRPDALAASVARALIAISGQSERR
jgi:hypothetical protein